jgi:hypothetical protein
MPYDLRIILLQVRDFLITGTIKKVVHDKIQIRQTKFLETHSHSLRERFFILKIKHRKFWMDFTIHIHRMWFTGINKDLIVQNFGL